MQHSFNKNKNKQKIIYYFIIYQHIMKFKFLSIIMAFAVALAFTACDEKKASSKSDKSDNDKSEQVEEKKAEEQAFELTGDPAKDAKTAAEELITFMNNIEFKSKADVDKFEDELQAIQDKYEKFYTEKGDDALKKFKEEFDKLENDPEISGKVEKAMENMQKKAMEFMK